MRKSLRSPAIGACFALALAACSSTSEDVTGPEQPMSTAPQLMASTLSEVDFEGFALGTPNGQFGWSRTGDYDHEIVTNQAGPPGFGSKSLRMSNGKTSFSFSDHTFAPPLADAAAETNAYSTLNLGSRQSRFIAQFSLASTVPSARQTGLSMQVSPDDGFGGRMSFVRFADDVAGIRVDFIDYQDVAPFGSTASPSDGAGDGDDFITTTVGTFDRAVPHTVRIEMELIDGPRNDVVRLYVDGTLVHTGTSWEDYFRWVQCGGCPEPTVPAGVYESRPVRTLGFFTRGTAVPDNLGKGFLFDNLSLESSSTTPVTVSGFFAPVDMGGVLNKAKAGQTIPLKFRITDANGTGIAVPGLTVTVSTSNLNCDAPTEQVDAIEEYSGNSGLQYLGDGNYQWNWKTPRISPSPCRLATLSLTAEGFAFSPTNAITAKFDFRR